MLVLSRKIGETLIIGENIVVKVVKIQGNRITLGIVAPSEVAVMRSELVKPAANKQQTQNEVSVQDGLLVAS